MIGRIEISAFLDFQKKSTGVTLSWKIASDFSLCVTLFFLRGILF
jgi:hypothetical protein